jgi:ADP-heptose:LPS heptosyltransferase
VVLLTDPVPRPEPRRHQVDEYMTLARAAGADGTEPEPRFEVPPSPERQKQVEQALVGAGVAADRPLVGLHLGAAGGAAKLWPAERFAALVGSVSQAGLTPVLLGGPADADRAEQSPPPPIPARPRSSGRIGPRCCRGC